MRLILFVAALVLFQLANAANFELTSSVLQNGQIMPKQYTCEGQDISPPLTWKNAPANTQYFALIFSDPDAPQGTWYHWVVYNISSNISAINENTITSGGIVGKNSWGHTTYNGPCPPKGSTHHYVFTLYALDTKVKLNVADAETVLQALQGHILQSATLTLIYQKE